MRRLAACCSAAQATTKTTKTTVDPVDQLDDAYVFAAHDDEKHPHVHLCVKSLGFDGARLNPRKADLQRWRERFAEALRERGIEANATPRASRGVGQKSIVQAKLHMKKEDRPARARADHSQPTVVAQDKFSVNPRTVHA